MVCKLEAFLERNSRTESTDIKGTWRNIFFEKEYFYSIVVAIQVMSKKRKLIDPDLVYSLCESNISWNEIANELHVSRSVLYKWRKDSNFQGPKINVDDIQLNQLISNNIEGQPRRGEVLVGAYISSLGLDVTRNQLRKSLHRVDSDGILFRKTKPIQRRVYSVAGPHHLWHHDGNHKLIRWGIVIHGCIDGCTRNIIYLAARDNNLSQSVFDLFINGVSRYQLPDRVRGDKGGENVLVAQYMISHRGINRSSYIAGSSTHNTRIERLWRDMRQHTIQAYIDLFRSLEEEGMDVCNLLHIYTLQYLFIPTINEALLLFTSIWNNHKLSTEHSRSPQQLLFYLKDSCALPEENINEEEYGIDIEAATDMADINQVDCAPIECPLSELQLLEFQQAISPITLGNGFTEFKRLFRDGLSEIKEIFLRT